MRCQLNFRKQWVHMFYKKDWEETKRIFEEWWDGVLDRPLIQVVYPRNEESAEIDSWTFLRYYLTLKRL